MDVEGRVGMEVEAAERDGEEDRVCGGARLAFLCGAPSRDEVIGRTVRAVDRAGGVRRVAGPRAPLVLTRIRSALGGVGSLRDHVSISEAETGDVEGRGKGGLAPPRRRRVTWIVHSLSSP